MPKVELYSILTPKKQLALLSLHDDTVWLVMNPKWYDLATIIWWLFTPYDRKKTVKLTLENGETAACKAIRIAEYYIKVKGIST